MNTLSDRGIERVPGSYGRDHSFSVGENLCIGPVSAIRSVFPPSPHLS